MCVGNGGEQSASALDSMETECDGRDRRLMAGEGKKSKVGPRSRLAKTALLGCAADNSRAKAAGDKVSS